jgi:transcriptional regulator with XRE-family HTH domain
MAHPAAKKRTPLARRIVAERANRGWTQRELAQQAKVSPITIANIERGEHGEIYATTLHRIATALEIPGAELYELFLETVEEPEGA